MKKDFEQNPYNNGKLKSNNYNTFLCHFNGFVGVQYAPTQHVCSSTHTHTKHNNSNKVIENMRKHTKIIHTLIVSLNLSTGSDAGWLTDLWLELSAPLKCHKSKKNFLLLLFPASIVFGKRTSTRHKTMCCSCLFLSVILKPRDYLFILLLEGVGTASTASNKQQQSERQ